MNDLILKISVKLIKLFPNVWTVVLKLPYGTDAVAQEVSRRLHTLAALVRVRVRLCGICGGRSGTGEILRLPLGSRGCCNSPNRGRHTKRTQPLPQTLRGPSPRANNTDQATVACKRR
jgi:hypothetical protein